MEHDVGLDVSLKPTAICIVDRTGKIQHEGVVALSSNLTTKGKGAPSALSSRTAPAAFSSGHAGGVAKKPAGIAVEVEMDLPRSARCAVPPALKSAAMTSAAGATLLRRGGQHPCHDYNQGGRHPKHPARDGKEVNHLDSTPLIDNAIVCAQSGRGH